MKKTLITLCVLIIATATMAQKNASESDHLKFMGIPICGTIKDFSKKLIARSNARPTGVYNGLFSFHGDFAGYDADLHVKYNKENREVYSAYAVVDSRTRERAEHVYDEFRSSLLKKYTDSFSKDDFSEEFGKVFKLWPKIDPKTKKFDPKKLYGEINLRIKYNRDLNVFGVFITYNDRINFDKYYNESKLADF